MIFFQYICENHFQRLQGRSMFTGLKAINHFGRPDMPSFLKFVQKKHSYVSVYLYISSFPRCILLSHSRVLKKLVKKKICMSNSNRNQKKGLKGQCLAIFSGRKFWRIRRFKRRIIWTVTCALKLVKKGKFQLNFFIFLFIFCCQRNVILTNFLHFFADFRTHCTQLQWRGFWGVKVRSLNILVFFNNNLP